jgi:exodeoxyribonuclease VII large subunit
VQSERALACTRAVVLERKTAATLLDARERRSRELAQLALVLAGHDPQRTLERGYALVQTPAGDALASAAGARAAGELRLRFADGVVPARVSE